MFVCAFILAIGPTDLGLAVGKGILPRERNSPGNGGSSPHKGDSSSPWFELPATPVVP